MEKPYILHVMTPDKNASPFDINMAYDAGWDAAVPYTGVELDDVADLVQDAIFSRGPKGVRRTGIFLGGRDMQLAMDMLDAAREAMVPPFEVSVFADPSGAFTTAAGLVTAVAHCLNDHHGDSLNDQRMLVLGGTGPVGAAAAILAAQAGAEVVIMGRRKDKADRVAALCNHNYGADLIGIEGDANDHKAVQLEDADIVLATAKAGIQVLDKAEMAAAPQLKIVADVNAVPPSGVEGVKVTDHGDPVAGTDDRVRAIGALAVGNIKYQAQHHLLQSMRESPDPLYLHFEHAYRWAMDHAR